MNFQFYLEKLHNSDEFKKFIKENPEAFMCSGFFTIDLEKKDNQRHIDFYIPKKKEVVSFKLDAVDSHDKNAKGVQKVPTQGNFGTNIQQDFLEPKEIDSEIDFDFDEVQKLIEEEIKKQTIKNKLQKIMISLQKVDGKDLLVCTVFVSMFGLLSVHIDPKDKKIIKFEKKNFLDFIRKAE
ncbi:MAG: hypothetical protein WDZ69_01890 [Candidatus Pacearchaeota archaeon]